jgi:dTMP kinase
MPQSKCSSKNKVGITGALAAFFLSNANEKAKLPLSFQRRKKMFNINRPEMRGGLIIFEGPDRSGKTTQVKRLSEYLKRVGVYHTTTREPGGTAFAEKIRHLVLHDPACASVNPTVLAHLFQAARLDHLENVIVPLVKGGEWVICDRFVESTMVYQGEELGGDHQTMEALADETGRYIVPDITFILEPPKNVDSRGRDNMERRAGDTWQHYHRRFAANQVRSKHTFLIHSGDEDRVHRDIRRCLDYAFGKLVCEP